MSERAYTLTEIDEMRRLVERLMEGPRYWHYSPSGCYSSSGGGYDPARRTAAVEDRLRTYMMAGTSLDELVAAVRELNDRETAQMERAKAEWHAKHGKTEAP